MDRKTGNFSDGKVRPWVRANKASIDWRFWERYKTYINNKKGIRDKALEGLDELTDIILNKIENPRTEGEWDTRGMVVGSVQSGKTANYVGLIAKALDAGYKLIIVLAGIHNNLRAQTQERIDEGIIGFDSQRRLDPNRTDYRVGVGQLIGPQLRITPLTSSAENGDFGIAAQKANVALGGDPVILVVKKMELHSNTFSSGSKWLRDAKVRPTSRLTKFPFCSLTTKPTTLRSTRKISLALTTFRSPKLTNLSG